MDPHSGLATQCLFLRAELPDCFTDIGFTRRTLSSRKMMGQASNEIRSALLPVGVDVYIPLRLGSPSKMRSHRRSSLQALMAFQSTFGAARGLDKSLSGAWPSTVIIAATWSMFPCATSKSDLVVDLVGHLFQEFGTKM